MCSASFCDNHGSQQRLIETCFKDPPWSALVGKISSFKSHVYSARWNTVLAAIREVCPILDILRRAWSLNKFKIKGSNTDPPSEKAEGGKTSSSSSRTLSPEAIDAVLGSDLFEAYGHTLLLVSSTLEHISYWGESCPCDKLCSDEEAHHDHKPTRLTCPLASRRAPELAAGAINDILHQAFAVSHGTLLCNAAFQKLKETDQHMILRDFAAARQRIVFGLSMKLGMWGQLPYCLFGLSHHNPEKASACARRALQLYLDAPEGTQHHPVVLELLSDESSVAPYVRELSMNPHVDRAKLGPLVPWLARFKFTPIAERYVEGLHARTKRALRGSPHAGAAHISFESQRPAIQAFIQSHPDQLPYLASLCHEARNGHRVLQVVGLLEHPLIVEALRKHGQRVFSGGRAGHKLAVQVLHHCDGRSQFQELSVPSSSMPKSSSSQHSQNNINIMYCKYMLAHFKHLLTSGHFDEGMYDVFSVGPFESDSRRQSIRLEVQECVNPSPALGLSDFPVTSMSGSSHSQAHVPQAYRIIWFKVVDTNPSRKILAGQAHVQGPETIAIAKLSILSVRKECFEVIAALEQTGGSGIDVSDIIILSSGASGRAH